MKKYNLIIISFLIFLTSSINSVHADGSSEYKEIDPIDFKDIGNGVLYKNQLARSKDTANSNYSDFASQNINVLKVPALNSEVKLVTWGGFSGKNGNPSVWGGMNLVNMATDFEENNPGWRVIAGVNSGFYSMEAANQWPLDAVVTNGNVYKTSINYQTKVLGINESGIFSLGHPTKTISMHLTIYDEFERILVENTPLHGFDSTPNLSKNTAYFSPITDYIVHSDEIVYVVENPHVIKFTSSEDVYGKGEITKVLKEGETFNLEHGQFALMSRKESMQDQLELGTVIRMQYLFKDGAGSFNEIFGYYGQPLEFGHVLSSYASMEGPDHSPYRHPRTILGSTEDGGFVLATVDGRQTNMSGMNLSELGELMKFYGCSDAYNLDGGGSTQMIIRENDRFVYANSPSETRRVTLGLFIVTNDLGINKVESSNVTSNSFDVNFDISQVEGIDIKKVEAIQDNNIVEMQDNKVKFTNLEENTDYSINFKVTYERDNKEYSYYLDEILNVSTINYVSDNSSNNSNFFLICGVGLLAIFGLGIYLYKRR